MGKLVLLLADGSSLDIPLDRERITIGRRADNDICLPYPAVSGEHAAVVTILADSFLEDLNSTNGTLVNDNRVAKHFLRDGDRIDIGLQQLVYRDESVAPAEREDETPRSGRTVRAPRPVPETPAAESTGDASNASGPATDGAPAEPAPLPDPPVQVRNAAQAESTRQTLIDALNRARRGAGGSRRDAEEMAATDAELPPAAQVDTAAAAPSIEPAERAPSRPETEAPRLPGSVRRLEPRTLAQIHVVSGPRSGWVYPVARAETLIGRPGDGIAALRQVDDLFRLVPVDGPVPVLLNGHRVVDEGTVIVPGDTFEVAGTQLRFARADAEASGS